MTSINVANLPGTLNMSYGSERGRFIVFINGTIDNGTSKVIDLANLVDGVGDIEGELFCSINQGVSATALTWSGTVLTIPSAGTTTHEVEVGVIVRST